MMKKRTVRIISAVIACVLALAMLAGIIATGLTYAGAADADELKDKLTSLEDQKAAVKAELEDLQTQVDSTQQTSAALGEQISITQQEIDTVTVYIEQLTTQINIKTRELAVAEDNLDTKYDLFCDRIRTMYENGETTYLDVLLNAKSFSDMLMRIDVVSQIMDYDKKVVAEYRAAKEDIETKRSDLQTTKAEQESYQENLNYKAEELAASKAEQEALLVDLASYQSLKQEEQERIEDEMADVSSQIAALSAAGAASGGATLYSGSFVWPTPGFTSTSSAYGWRTHPIFGTRRFHAGEDIPANSGAPILAAASGTVTTAGWVSGYGNYTVIDHGGGVMTAYGHQSAIYVSVGQTVTAGDTIGAVGSTGNSTGPHLHFEVYINGSTVNPMDYFS